MFISADMLLCHAIGDYLVQSDWMATEKLKKSSAALAHALSYTACFFFLTTSWKALLLIGATHFVIDRWRLARYVVWVKNFLAPRWIETITEHMVGPNQIKITPKDGFAAIIMPERMKISTKNLIRNYPWSECSGTGYHKDRPPFLAVWLLIIADNTLHIICNGVALRWL